MFKPLLFTSLFIVLFCFKRMAVQHFWLLWSSGQRGIKNFNFYDDSSFFGHLLILYGLQVNFNQHLNGKSIFMMEINTYILVSVVCARKSFLLC